MVVHPSHGLILAKDSDSTRGLQLLEPVHDMVAESEKLLNEKFTWRTAGIRVKGVAESGRRKALLVSKKDSAELLAVWSSALKSAMHSNTEKAKEIIKKAIDGNQDRSQTCSLATLPGPMLDKLFDKVG